MAFESLSEKLNAAFKKLRGKGRLTPNDVKEAMREEPEAQHRSEIPERGDAGWPAGRR